MNNLKALARTAAEALREAAPEEREEFLRLVKRIVDDPYSDLDEVASEQEVEVLMAADGVVGELDDAIDEEFRDYVRSNRAITAED